jgi:hypothetical protein
MPGEAPWVEHEGKRLALRRLDPLKNAKRKRPPRGGPAASKPTHPVNFDPMRALLRGADSTDCTKDADGEDAPTPAGGVR